MSGYPINGLVILFGNLRIKAFWQLPEAYRSLIRPSSVLSTKASTVCINVEILFGFFVLGLNPKHNLAFIHLRLNRRIFIRIHISKCKLNSRLAPRLNNLKKVKLLNPNKNLWTVADSTPNFASRNCRTATFGPVDPSGLGPLTSSLQMMRSTR